VNAQEADNQTSSSQRVVGIGIDFGTSKSAVAIARSLCGKEVEILKVRKKEETSNQGAVDADLMFFPSLVQLEMRDKQRLLFTLQEQIGPPRPPEGDSNAFVTMNFKLRIGEDWQDKEGLALERVLSGFMAPQPRPEELAGCVMYRLRAAIKHGCDNDVAAHGCVLSIPSGWKYKQRRATVYAARMAGFQDIELIEEPVASLIGLYERLLEGLYLVIDYGAGTCDVALIEKGQDDRYFVIDSGSDNKLGGGNIDRELLEWAISGSPYKLDHERSTMLGGELEPDDSFKYYDALWHIEKWKVENNELFLRGKKKSTGLFIRGLQDLQTSISKEDFEKKVKDSVDKRLEKLLRSVLNNHKGRLLEVRRIVLTGGSSRIIGFKDMVVDHFAKVSGMGRESVEVLVLEAKDPQWTVVRGAALASYGLATRKPIFAIPLRNNVELEIRDKAGKELRLLSGYQEIRRHSTPEAKKLPCQGKVVVQAQDDTPYIHINVYKGTKKRKRPPVDRLTIAPIRGHSKVPASTWMQLEYQVRMDETVQIQSCLFEPELHFEIEHEAFHHTDKDGNDTNQLIQSREKYSLYVDSIKHGCQKPKTDYCFKVRRFISQVNWGKRLANCFIAFIAVLVLLRSLWFALIIAVVLAAVFPENVDLLELVLKITNVVRDTFGSGEGDQ